MLVFDRHQKNGNGFFFCVALCMKTMQQRLEECVQIRTQLRNLQCDADCQPLHRAMTEFVARGVSASGSFFVPSAQRKLQYMLSNKHDSFAVLKANV